MEEEERQFGFSQVLAVVKRRFWWIVVPVLLGPVVGIGLTFAVRPVYTSKAFVLIEQPKVPDKFVPQVISDQLDTRLMTLQEQILSRSRLEPIILRLGLFKGSTGRMSMEDMVERLRKAIVVQMITPEGSNRVPSGFYITASADSGRTAQEVCSEILSMFMAENVKIREQSAAGTTDFLTGQLETSKRALDDQDAKLAEFKQKFMGQLPTDEQRNLELLTATRTRLEAVNQELNQSQQQKIIQESALSQLNARKAVPSAVSTAFGPAAPSDLERELTTLQAQLAALQARDTEQHPDVIKTKAQIKFLQSQLKAANSAANSATNATAAAPAAETAVPDTPEQGQLRVSLQLTDQNIRAKRAEQATLEGQVRELESRLQLSPVVEERYKALTRDYETALQFYNDLLSKRTQSEMATDLERRQEGEQFAVMDSPDLPAKPSFPDRVKFAGIGLAAGLALGTVLTFVLERRDNFIRTEEDALHILGLPVLVELPEVDFQQAAVTASKPKRREEAGKHQPA